VARYKAVVDDAVKLKLIRRAVPVDGWFDTQYVKNSLKKLGLEKRWAESDAKGNPRQDQGGRRLGRISAEPA
jgi:sulfonate transport system substrate-binding protein